MRKSNFKKWALAIALGLSAIQPINAAPLTLNDFSHHAVLSEGSSSLREVALPTDVYKKMHRNDLGDIRVFNAEGQPVPHQFSRTKAVGSSKVLTMVFYPFDKQQAENTGNIQVIIKQKADEQSLRINQQNGSNMPNKSEEYQYIIENTFAKNKDEKLCQLKFEWQQPKPTMVLGLKLETSADLQNWRTLKSRANISKLNYSGSELVRDKVKFSCTTQKYLRMRWLKPQQGVHLKSIQGTYRKKGEQATQWTSLGNPQTDSDNNWLFESNVVSAFSQMEFIAPQDGLLYKGTLYSRKNDNDKWRYRANVTQYRLKLGDDTFESSPLKISASNNRYWKLELSTEAQFTESQLPEIRVAWKPRKLLFLAQGNGPFTVAFGNQAVTKTSNNNLQGLIKDLSDSGVKPDLVKLGDIVQANKKLIKGDTFNWKKYLLWLVLILGTMLMAFMAWRLFQQMSSETNNDI